MAYSINIVQLVCQKSAYKTSILFLNILTVVDNEQVLITVNPLLFLNRRQICFRTTCEITWQLFVN